MHAYILLLSKIPVNWYVSILKNKKTLPYDKTFAVASNEIQYFFQYGIEV